MHLSLNLLLNKRKYLFALMLLLMISAIFVAFGKDSNGFDNSRREVLLRRIGHEILLQSGDNTSRVLPVEKIAENEYEISFENKLSFQPDSLVNTIKRVLAKDPQAQDYVVNVLNCDNASVAYGYAISKNNKEDIVACLGRTQPIACYRINIKLKPIGIITAQSGYLLGSLSVFALVGFVFLRSFKERKSLPERQNTNIFTLGSISFLPESHKLKINGKTINLTRTENRVLRIFAMSPNQVIERSRLQKEIWEDDGVIVGRSLDMFVSKLRKKLEYDPNVKIVVIRGKGYRLEINS